MSAPFTSARTVGWEHIIKCEKVDKEKPQCKATVDVDLTKILNRIIFPTDSQILDVTTGAGTIPCLLGSNLVGLDVSIETLKEAKRI